MTDPPVVLGRRYRLLESVGTGGMATVWRAHDEVLSRPVAVKMVAMPEPDRRPECLRMLRAEALTVARLSHPHLTAVYDYGEERVDGQVQPYLVMEFVDGVTLLQALRAAPHGLGWARAVEIAGQAAAALAAAHARGVVHRDVTPGNIMLTADGVKVLDFGICVPAGSCDSGDELIGTVDYIAPERVAGTDEVTAACDVYALGVVLYRCLTGRMPWRDTGPTQRLRDHLVAPPNELPPIGGLPAEVRQLCLSCLAKDPAARPSAAEVAAALGWERSAARPARAGVAATRVAPRPSRGTWWERTSVLVAGAAAATGLTGVLVVGSLPGSAPAARFTPNPAAVCQGVPGQRECPDEAGIDTVPDPAPAAVPVTGPAAGAPVAGDHRHAVDGKGKDKGKGKGKGRD